MARPARPISTRRRTALRPGLSGHHARRHHHGPTGAAWALGIGHLVAVIGPSYGGAQAFQWAVTFPDFVDGIVPVTADYKGDGGAGLARLLTELEADPHWNGGRYYDKGGVRENPHPHSHQDPCQLWHARASRGRLPDTDARQAEIERVAGSWASEFDANSLIALAGPSPASISRMSYPGSGPGAVRAVSHRPGLPAHPRADRHGPTAGCRRARRVRGDRQCAWSRRPGLDGERWAPRLAAFMAALMRVAV